MRRSPKSEAIGAGGQEPSRIPVRKASPLIAPAAAAVGSGSYQVTVREIVAPQTPDHALSLATSVTVVPVHRRRVRDWCNHGPVEDGCQFLNDDLERRNVMAYPSEHNRPFK